MRRQMEADQHKAQRLEVSICRWEGPGPRAASREEPSHGAPGALWAAPPRWGHCSRGRGGAAACAGQGRAPRGTTPAQAWRTGLHREGGAPWAFPDGRPSCVQPSGQPARTPRAGPFLPLLPPGPLSQLPGEITFPVKGSGRGQAAVPGTPGGRGSGPQPPQGVGAGTQQRAPPEARGPHACPSPGWRRRSRRWRMETQPPAPPGRAQQPPAPPGPRPPARLRSRPRRRWC